MDWDKLTLKQVEGILLRYVWPVFFVLAMLGLIVFGARFLQANEVLAQMETTLLDTRLQIRATRFDPSPDIVLVAMDDITERDSREYPGLGLTSRTPPRSRVADVIRYLHQEGAKAVILDYEYREKKPGDETLAQAIRKADNVFAAAQVDGLLEDFIGSADELGPDQLASLIVFQLFLRPHIDNAFIERQLHLATSAPDISLLGINGVMPVNLPYVPYPAIAAYMANYRLRFLLTAGQAGGLTSRLPAFADLSDPEKSLFKRDCVIKTYERFYKNTPEYLEILARNAVPIQFHQPPGSLVERQSSYCFTAPVSPVIGRALKGIAYPSIEYDYNAYIREIPVFLRGYRDYPMTYLGILPAMDALDIKTLHYFGEAIRFGEREIPLYDGFQTLINWRHPKKLYTRLAESAGEIDNPVLRPLIDSLDPGSRNKLLGNGHFYKVISMSHLLRQIRGGQYLPQNKQERTNWSMYNLHGFQKTGEFSFKDKYVIIGDTVKDIHRTPMGDTTYGPEVVATVLDMFLHDDQFVWPAPGWMSTAITALVCLLVLIAVLWFFENMALGFLMAVGLIGAYWYFNFQAFSNGFFTAQAYWFPLVWPSLWMGVTLAGGMIYRYSIRDREKKQLTTAFSNFVSPQIMQEITKNPGMALENLKGERKELTVLFSDIQDFTAQFERVDPEVMVYQLNQYLDVMTDIILAHGGTYDKYMGDAIMAFFGAPVPVPNHAAQACEAAFEMTQALAHLNKRFQEQGFRPLKHGIGISTGDMFVGNFGSKKIKNFTVMGSNVNLGSRLEALTRPANTPVIISERTRELALSRIEAQDLGMAKIKGFREPVRVYALTDVKQTVGGFGSWKIR